MLDIIILKPMSRLKKLVGTLKVVLFDCTFLYSLKYVSMYVVLFVKLFMEGSSHILISFPRLNLVQPHVKGYPGVTIETLY